MQETLNSLVRLSAAMTVFGMQQVQTAVGSADTKESVDKLREVIDAMAAAVSAKIDESKLPTLDSISSLGHDVVDRTMDSLKVPTMNPLEILKNTTGMVKTTSDWLDGFVRAAAPGSSEPKGR